MFFPSPDPKAQRRLSTRLWFPRPLEEVFAFFSDAGQLETITPPWLHFEVLTPRPIEIQQGTLIDYRLRLHGLPIRWRTLISVWEPGVRFVDEQLIGPYRYWRHEHRFFASDGGTAVFDDVDYAVPGGWLVERMFVRRDLKRIFSYREQTLNELFGAGECTVKPAARNSDHSPRERESCS